MIARSAPTLIVFLAALGCARPPSPASGGGSSVDRTSDPPQHQDEEEEEDGACPCRKKLQAETPAPLPHPAAPADHPPAEGQGEAPSPRGVHVIPHANLKSFENNGNSLVGVVTPSLGSSHFEIWRTSVAVGSKTPVHTHSSQEVFVVLEGSGVAHVGSEAVPFRAPATVIAPAGIPHYIENTGDIPTDSLVVVEAHSRIENARGETMNLPWRR